MGFWSWFYCCGCFGGGEERDAGNRNTVTGTAPQPTTGMRETIPIGLLMDTRSAAEGLTAKSKAISWTSPKTLTKEGLMKMRDVFWETAPAYGGQPPVWAALRAVCETDDLELGGAILASLCLTLPQGMLTDVYDDHGFRYALPPYCICPPVNYQEDTCIIEVKKEKGSEAVKVVEEVDLRTIIIRFANDYSDLRLSLSPDTPLSQVSSDILQKLDLSADKKVLFFLYGKGPLEHSLSLKALHMPTGTILQAMIRT